MGIFTENDGVKVDSGNLNKILIFSDFVKIDVESVLRNLTGQQTLTPEQRKRIGYLYAIEFGKVKVKVHQKYTSTSWIKLEQPLL